MPQSSMLNDRQLQELMADPMFTPADEQLLTDQERQRLTMLRSIQDRGVPAGEDDGNITQRVMGTLSDYGVGWAKGGGKTAFHLGKGVNAIPGVGDLTGKIAQLVGPGLERMMGQEPSPQGIDPDQAFADLPPELRATNFAQRTGMLAEQLAEFFLPGLKTGKVLNMMSKGRPNRIPMTMAGELRNVFSRPLQQAIPDAIWNNLSRTGVTRLNRATNLAAGMGAEGAMATGIAAAHGDEDPMVAGLFAAGGPLVGAAGTQFHRQLIELSKHEFGRRVIGFLAGMLGYNVAGAFGDVAGIAGAIGGYGLGQELAHLAVQNPQVAKMIQHYIRVAGRGVGRAAAGTSSATRTMDPSARGSMATPAF